MPNDETTTADVLASYTGTVTRCPPGRASAADTPDAKQLPDANVPSERSAPHILDHIGLVAHHVHQHESRVRPALGSSGFVDITHALLHLRTVDRLDNAEAIDRKHTTAGNDGALLVQALP